MSEQGLPDVRLIDRVRKGLGCATAADIERAGPSNAGVFDGG
jgi:hypothetical protein